MNTAIFKAYDVRGKVGSELNEETCKRIGSAFADWLPTEGAVVVGRDMRPDSEALAGALIAGLRAQGRDVWDIGQVTSDMVYFTVGNFELAGGAMITASHNPGDYNGIKFCGVKASPVGIDSGLLQIRDRAYNDDFVPAAKPGALEQKNVIEAWIKHVLSQVAPDSWPSYKVAIDAGNGMAGATVPTLEKHVPLKVTEMYFELDGTFPNHIANPLEAKNLVDLQAKIKQENCDFGIAFDGDGDRAVLVDEKGQPLSGTVVTALLARYFLAKNPGATVLYNLICGKVVPETIEAAGGKAVRTKVGHSYIKADMRTHGAVFAGEHSGHYYFNFNYNADSGLIAAVTAIQILTESGKKLSELAAEFRGKYATLDETNFEASDTKAVIARLKQTFEDAQQEELDGLTVTYPTKWFNVRASNTEPMVRLNAEAATQEELAAFVKQIVAVIEAK